MSAFCSNFAAEFHFGIEGNSKSRCSRFTISAALAELVDAPDLGSGSSQSVGSSPICRTYEKVHIYYCCFCVNLGVL